VAIAGWLIGCRPTCSAAAAAAVAASTPRSDPHVVVTIMEPYAGAIYRNTNNVVVAVTFEMLQKWEASEPVAVVSLDQAGSGFGSVEFTRVPLPELSSGAAGAHEKAFTMAQLPNGDYNLTVIVHIDGVRGHAEHARPPASTRFTVDIAVELTKIEEEDTDETDTEEGGSTGKYDVAFTDEDLKGTNSEKSSR